MQTLEKELLEMSHSWKETAREMIAKSEKGSRSEMVNRMLFCCAEMLEWKIENALPNEAIESSASLTHR